MARAAIGPAALNRHSTFSIAVRAHGQSVTVAAAVERWFVMNLDLLGNTDKHRFLPFRWGFEDWDRALCRLRRAPERIRVSRIDVSDLEEDRGEGEAEDAFCARNEPSRVNAIVTGNRESWEAVPHIPRLRPLDLEAHPGAGKGRRDAIACRPFPRLRAVQGRGDRQCGPGGVWRRGRFHADHLGGPCEQVL